jgi:hypothetical protein
MYKYATTGEIMDTSEEQYIQEKLAGRLHTIRHILPIEAKMSSTGIVECKLRVLGQQAYIELLEFINGSTKTETYEEWKARMESIQR